MSKAKSKRKVKNTKKKNSFAYQVPDGYETIGGKARLYPDQTQKAQLYQAFGSSRFVYNHFKALMDTRYKLNPKQFFPKTKYLMRMLANLKKRPQV